MQRTSGFAWLAALLVPVPVAVAQWQGKGEVGVVFTRGNSDTDTVNLKIDSAHELGRWKNAIGLAALRAANDGERTGERYGATWQSDYRFSGRGYVYGGLRYELDEFSGFDYQASATTGLGYRVIDDPGTRLSAQAGVGYRASRLAPPVGETDREVILRGDVRFDHEFSAAVKVVDTLVVESGAENLFASNDLALQVRMTDRFALSLALGLRYNSNPPPALRQTDALTTVNLVYAF
jgi:putative salt-induced outer membrane protein